MGLTRLTGPPVVVTPIPAQTRSARAATWGLMGINASMRPTQIAPILKSMACGKAGELTARMRTATASRTIANPPPVLVACRAEPARTIRLRKRANKREATTKAMRPSVRKRIALGPAALGHYAC